MCTILNWTCLGDAGLFDRVARHEGLTVEEIAIGAGEPIDVLIAKAHPRYPGWRSCPMGNCRY